MLFGPENLDGKDAARHRSRSCSCPGRSPVTQQLLIIQRVAVKAIRCACLEQEILRKVDQKRSVSADTDQRYLRYSRELRADLKLLGLSQQQQPVVNLQEYLSQKTERKRK